MLNLRSRKTYLVLFCIYLAAVAVACFTKPSNLPDMGAGTLLGIPMDKVLHFILFLPFPVLASMSMTDPRRKPAVNIAVLALMTVVGIGVAYVTEALQAELGYRSYDLKDLYADSLGIITGALATAVIINCTRLEK